MAGQTQTVGTTRRLRPEVSAWLTLLIFFCVFCTLVASAGVAGWRYYLQATDPRGAIGLMHARGAVGYQPKGSDKPEIPETACQNSNDICFNIEEGGLIEAFDRTNVGPVGSVVLEDGTQIDLYAYPSGTVLRLEQYRVSRWNQRQQEVVLRQTAGYARYDVRKTQPYSAVSYTVIVGEQANDAENLRVQLEPGGSYSINILDDKTATAQPSAPRVEVAVRDNGSITIEGGSLASAVFVRPGEKAQVSAGSAQVQPVDATWELIQDGGFTEHTTDEYNQRTDTWTVSAYPAVQNMPLDEQNGVFRVPPKTCPPTRPDICEAEDQVHVGQFRREGQNGKPYVTGIVQTLDVDISEYTQSLRFSAWVRVLKQSPPLTGDAGSECPLMLRLRYKKTSLTDNPQEHVTCFYTGEGTPVRSPGINYEQLSPFVWNKLELELRNDPDLQAARYIQDIRIEARGHDYLAEITDISLVGIQ